ncbi:MAG: hypothetical protein R3360_05510, partial [Alphaproteobacteria bacterium]|nr:hypothetical protein [Alphaproteobacteria bacterium]
VRDSAIAIEIAGFKAAGAVAVEFLFSDFAVTIGIHFLHHHLAMLAVVAAMMAPVMISMMIRCSCASETEREHTSGNQSGEGKIPVHDRALL